MNSVQSNLFIAVLKERCSRVLTGLILGLRASRGKERNGVLMGIYVPTRLVFISKPTHQHVEFMVGELVATGVFAVFGERWHATVAVRVESLMIWVGDHAS